MLWRWHAGRPTASRSIIGCERRLDGRLLLRFGRNGRRGKLIAHNRRLHSDLAGAIFIVTSNTQSPRASACKSAASEATIGNGLARPGFPEGHGPRFLPFGFEAAPTLRRYQNDKQRSRERGRSLETISSPNVSFEKAPFSSVTKLCTCSTLVMTKMGSKATGQAYAMPHPIRRGAVTAPAASQ